MDLEYIEGMSVAALIQLVIKRHIFLLRGAYLAFIDIYAYLWIWFPQSRRRVVLVVACHGSCRRQTGHGMKKVIDGGSKS